MGNLTALHIKSKAIEIETISNLVALATTKNYGRIDFNYGAVMILIYDIKHYPDANRYEQVLYQSIMS